LHTARLNWCQGIETEKIQYMLDPTDLNTEKNKIVGQLAGITVGP